MNENKVTREVFKLLELELQNCHFYQKERQEVDLYASIIAVETLEYVLRKAGVDVDSLDCNDEMRHYSNLSCELNEELTAAIDNCETREHLYIGANPMWVEYRPKN